MANVDICDTTSWDCKYWTLNSGIGSSGGFANVFLSSSFVSPGDSLTINAMGFDASETLTVKMSGQTVKTTTSDSNGDSTSTMIVPPGVSPGFYPVEVEGTSKKAFSELNVFSTTGDDAKKILSNCISKYHSSNSTSI